SLGPNHPDVGKYLNNLGTLYERQDRHADSEPLFKRALAIYEKAVGPDHPAVATLVNNLGQVYKAEGREADAEPLIRRSLAIREARLGRDHPDVARSLNNLADLYQRQGRYADAEPLFKRALAIREQAVGPDHPDTIASPSWCAGIRIWVARRRRSTRQLLRRSPGRRRSGMLRSNSAAGRGSQPFPPSAPERKRISLPNSPIMPRCRTRCR